MEDISKKIRGQKVAESPINKLKAKLLQKQKMLQEIFSLAREISSLNNPFLNRTESEKELGGESSKNSRYNNSCPRRDPKRPTSFKGRRDSSKNLSATKPDNTVDMRKLALKNVIQKKIYYDNNTPRSKASPKIEDSSFEEACANQSNSERSRATPTFAISNSRLLHESSMIWEDNTPELDENFGIREDPAKAIEVYEGISRSYSLNEVSHNLLDAIDDDAYGADNTKNKKRYNSFVEELLESHEYEGDPRLNNSCVLDGILKQRVKKNLLLRKANSVELEKEARKSNDSDTTLNINLKKYFW